MNDPEQIPGLPILIAILIGYGVTLGAIAWGLWAGVRVIMWVFS